jgi:hypothetical protein
MCGARRVSYAVVTATTVGFGDYYPETFSGKVFTLFYVPFSGKKTRLFALPFCVLECIILPRQARDKHRETQKERRVFL